MENSTGNHPTTSLTSQDAVRQDFNLMEEVSTRVENSGLT